MVRPRFAKLEPQRQEKILEAAGEEFAEHGYDAASVNRIVDRAGLSKGSLYYYFDDKNDLFSTTIERATARLIQRAGGIDLATLTADTFWPRFDELSRRTVRQLERHAWYVKLARSFYRWRARSGTEGPTARAFDVVRRVTRDVLARGQELGAVRRDVPLAFLVELTLAVGEAGDRWLLDRWEELSVGDREIVLDAEMDTFRRLLATPVHLP